MIAATPVVFEGAGRRLVLGGELARGGEGTIVEVAGRPEVVAKLYHAPPDADKAAKLAAMMHERTERLAALAAWPLATLHGGQRGPVVGFLMPRLTGV